MSGQAGSICSPLERRSKLDEKLRNQPAQYANENGTPLKIWDDVTTELADIDTSELHYVKVPPNHIVIDFDLKDENGEKSLEKNIEAASKWPPTYAEVSKSGKGLHLHYLYPGDTSVLSPIFDEGIEVKVFNGNASLRRKLIACNDLDINVLSSGLPVRQPKKVNRKGIKNEGHLRHLIGKALKKEIHPDTKSNMDYIRMILDEAYETGVPYDVENLRELIRRFGARSTNQSDYCTKLVDVMHFSSDVLPKDDDDTLVFFDMEVRPNVVIICWMRDDENVCHRIFNPTSADAEKLIKMNLVGFNNRKYDNHILYGIYLGNDANASYRLSKRIIKGDKNAFYGAAYNISKVDVYDMSSDKKSLKRWEVELGFPHDELDVDWNTDAPESEWERMADYCENDVRATKAVFHARESDWKTREMLAAITGLSTNDTTNTHTGRMIFGDDRAPQKNFEWRNLGEQHNEQGRPVFPGYEFDHGKSMYRGEDVGNGGYVYAEPGVHRNVALLDVASMHPSSIIAENLFGDKYTARFKELYDARIAIKHKDFDTARKMMDGALAPYLDNEEKADELASALKLAINSVYGLTAAGFNNLFRDQRNVDNIVAKRGALFMVNLKHEVQERGYTVAHIKTDSIKIPEADEEIIQFVTEYGKQYGYNFEHEATYDRMCLVNDAVYIAAYMSTDKCMERHNYIPSANAKHFKKHKHPWTATGAQFQVPYVFKTVFSKEPIIFDDRCEIKQVTTAMYLDFNENLEKGDHDYKFVGKCGKFSPVKAGCGGGLLMRKKEDKYSNVTGTKGYRWKESDVIKNLGQEDQVDDSYYRKLAEDAIDTIENYISIDEFTGGIE